MTQNINFYVCEIHSYAGTFSFIAELYGMARTELKNAFVTDNINPLSDFWVEIRNEGTKTILAGSGFLETSLNTCDLKLIVESLNGGSTSFIFPSPSFIEQGILSCNLSDDECKVKFWSRHGLTDIQPVNYHVDVNEAVHSIQSNVYLHEKRITCPKPGAITTLPKASPEQHMPDDLFRYPKDIRLEEIRRLKDVHKGKDAVFIGNGPSLDLNTLGKFNQHIFFAFNRFYLAYKQTDFRPNYLISADAQMIKDFGSEMIEKSESNVILAADNFTDLNGSYIWLKLVNIFPALFSEDIGKFVTPGGATPYVAMQIAAYMGIRNIYLLGFDYGYKFNTYSNDNNSNFVRGDGNHFINNYRNDMPWVPPSYRNIGHSFWTARLYFEALGGEIINLTSGSSLKTFKNSSLTND